MSKSPIQETAGPLECPVCNCDHQQFKGVGIFHPTQDGTKLVTIFPTAGVLATIDLPQDIKVGSTTIYTRYACLCGQHNWAEVTAWHEDHSVTWCVQLEQENLPPGSPLPPGSSPLACSGEQNTPEIPVQGLPQAQTPSLSNTLMSAIAGALGSPLLQMLGGGHLTPILIMPVPVPVPGLQSELPPPASPMLPTNKSLFLKPSKEAMMKVLEEAPRTAAVSWVSWRKKIIAGKTSTMFPVLPLSKGPHFYVAGTSTENVIAHREWLMNMVLDIPEDTGKVVHAFLLWHDYLFAVLNLNEIGPELQKRILGDITVALMKHDSVRVATVGLYRKKDYAKILRPKE